MILRVQLFSLLIFLCFPIFAISQANKDLLLSCQKFNSNKNDTPLPCHYFIQGFLSSALAIDSSLHEKQSKKKYQHYRTKGRTLPARFIYYCIPENQSDADVIINIARLIPNNIDDMKILRNNIFNLLQTQYPCSKVDLS